eukprot:747653-Rhodomonas_salina.3
MDLAVRVPILIYPLQYRSWDRYTSVSTDPGTKHASTDPGTEHASTGPRTGVGAYQVRAPHILDEHTDVARLVEPQNASVPEMQ